MIVTCPYCHKKLYVTTRWLVLKGRLSVGCPNCNRQVYAALRKQLLAVQFLMIFAAVLICARLGMVNVPGGVAGKIALLAAGLALVMALAELCARFVARDAMLRYRTEKLLEKEKQTAAAKKAEERAARKKGKTRLK